MKLKLDGARELEEAAAVELVELVSGMPVVNVVVKGGEKEVMIEVTVVKVPEVLGRLGGVVLVLLAPGVLEDRVCDDEGDADTVAEEEAAAHICTKMWLTSTCSVGEHDDVPLHCSTLAANDVLLHRHEVSARSQPTAAAADSAHPSAQAGRVVA